MKKRFVSDALTALLVGIVLHFAGAPFWVTATVSIGIFALLGVLNVFMDAMDMFGKALDDIIVILKSK